MFRICKSTFPGNFAAAIAVFTAAAMLGPPPAGAGAFSPARHSLAADVADQLGYSPLPVVVYKSGSSRNIGPRGRSFSNRRFSNRRFSNRGFSNRGFSNRGFRPGRVGNRAFSQRRLLPGGSRIGQYRYLPYGFHGPRRFGLGGGYRGWPGSRFSPSIYRVGYPYGPLVGGNGWQRGQYGGWPAIRGNGWQRGFYDGYGYGGGYGGALVISNISSGEAGPDDNSGQAYAEESCEPGKYCVIRLGGGYNAPKIITLDGPELVGTQAPAE